MIFTQRYRIPFTPVTKHSSLPNGSSVDRTMATETGGFRQLVITYRWTVWKFVTSDSDICGIGREGLDAEGWTRRNDKTRASLSFFSREQRVDGILRRKIPAVLAFPTELTWYGGIRTRRNTTKRHDTTRCDATDGCSKYTVAIIFVCGLRYHPLEGIKRD